MKPADLLCALVSVYPPDLSACTRTGKLAGEQPASKGAPNQKLVSQETVSLWKRAALACCTLFPGLHEFLPQACLHVRAAIASKIICQPDVVHRVLYSELWRPEQPACIWKAEA